MHSTFEKIDRNDIRENGYPEGKNLTKQIIKYLRKHMGAAWKVLKEFNRHINISDSMMKMKKQGQHFCRKNFTTLRKKIVSCLHKALDEGLGCLQPIIAACQKFKVQA